MTATRSAIIGKFFGLPGTPEARSFEGFTQPTQLTRRAEFLQGSEEHQNIGSSLSTPTQRGLCEGLTPFA